MVSIIKGIDVSKNGCLLDLTEIMISPTHQNIDLANRHFLHLIYFGVT